MIHVLIADDRPVVRAGLSHFIEKTTDIIVSGEATQGTAILEVLRTRHLDLLLLDMSMPDINGIELIRRVRVEWPALAILIMSEQNEAPAVSRALRAGATGYVAKDTDHEILIGAVYEARIATSSENRTSRLL
ncbi:MULTISPECIES: response regulator [Paraburkholderia]|uniref:response regulator n=1 Tax=Paraburkholderia TaxID=1822464 RepID=UPI00037361E7|nr:MULTISPECIES: response regulator transcription factor [Paraburkholderia]MDH6153282.1 DNA-binding NarL/FixJ family response regulator [Paraburkholderia sp. WSM4179]